MEIHVLEKLRGDLAKLKDWRVIILLAVSLPLLFWVIGPAAKITLGALAVVGIAAALALVYRKWLAPNVSAHYDNAKGSPVASSIIYLASCLVICTVILAVAYLSAAR